MDTADEVLQLLQLFFTNARQAGDTHVLDALYTKINEKLVEPNCNHEVYARFSRRPITQDNLIIHRTATPTHIFLLSLNEYIERS